MAKLDRLDKNMKDVVSKFKDLKNSGVDEELLIIYIKDKTKLPTRDIKKMLDKQEEFYNKLVKEEVVNSLENDNK